MRLRMLIVATVLPLGALLLPAPAPAMPPQPDTRQAELPKPLVIPEADRKKTNPVPNVKAAIDSGRNLFSSQCTMCHGAQGAGRGDLAISLKMKMPDLTDPQLHRKRTDGDLFYIISLGPPRGEGRGGDPAGRAPADSGQPLGDDPLHPDAETNRRALGDPQGRRPWLSGRSLRPAAINSPAGSRTCRCCGFRPLSGRRTDELHGTGRAILIGV